MWLTNVSVRTERSGEVLCGRYADVLGEGGGAPLGRAPPPEWCRYSVTALSALTTPRP
ncbi:hypothetical protein BX283_2531 [Streptomyces sp. TLI_146]|nr:hypothetical protein BX283_2531 [Streptomyces sp. TLI_146]